MIEQPVNQELTTELVRNAYRLPAWQIGIRLADGTVAVNPDSQKYTEHEARRTAAEMQARKPFVARVALTTPPASEAQTNDE